MTNQTALFELLLRLGDDRLVLGSRISEWCGHGPVLEEDIALANIALDLIGHAQAILSLAGKVENQGRDEDKLAYFRDSAEFRNSLICELPRGDFGFTITRQLLFSAFSYLQWEEFSRCKVSELAGIASKALKETRYHLTHCSEWLIRLGDGTPESHKRCQDAIDSLWSYTGDMFFTDSAENALVDSGECPDISNIQLRWHSIVEEVIKAATLQIPNSTFMHTGGRVGRHTEHLGHLLSEMQILPRSHPDARW